MTLPVHLVPDLAGVRVGDELVVEGDEAHHAVAVRRLRVGERLVLTDGAGVRAEVVATALGKRTFTTYVEAVASQPEPTPRVVVVQALPKGERGELAVEMLTEVGAGLVVPWAAERSVAVWKGERAAKSLARWRATAREAAKQARRSWHPQVADLARTADVVALLAAADLAVVLHEEAAEPIAGLRLPAAGTVAIVVGPEGGLSEAEVAAFTAAGAHLCRLGAEVLRTSTAGVAAVAALLTRTPRWGGGPLSSP